MGFCCADCGDGEHTCTAWDGTGWSKVNDQPNHNLVETCPTDVTKCKYRHKKIQAKPIKGR